MKKELKDAYSSLKVGGTLIIPIDETLEGVNLSKVLEVSEDRIVWSDLSALARNPDVITESPVLPQNARGMGTSYGDYYTVVKR